MPLHAHHGLQLRALHRLGHAVGRPRRNLQRLAGRLYGLVMKGVYGKVLPQELPHE